jgi:hypothetical protein
MSLRHFASSLCLMCVALLAGKVAQAEPPSKQSLGQADAHFKQGVQLFKQGAFEGALVEFRKAHELVPDFRVQFNIGRSCVELRDAACALVAYRSYLTSADQLAPERVLEVQAEVARLEPMVGSVRISTSAESAALSLDDVQLGPAPLAEAILVNAGRHRVSARFADGTSDTRVIEVAGGEQEQVALAPEAQPLAPPPSTSSAPIAIAAPTPVRDRQPSKVWIGWVASGVLAAAAGTTGTLALSARSQAKHDASQADGGATLASSNSRTHALAAVTDVLLGTAAVTAGLTLYFTLRSPSPRPSAPPSVSLAITPRAVQLGYRF